MIEFLKRFSSSILSFIVGTIHRLTILATLVSIGVCLVLFYLTFLKGEPIYAVLSLAGMLCCVYVNKQF